MALDFFQDPQSPGYGAEEILRQTFGMGAGGGGRNFSGLGGFAVSPGFALQAMPVFQQMEERRSRQRLVEDLLRGGGGPSYSYGGQPVADPTSAIFNSMIADLTQREGAKNRALESRFSSLGRGLSSTAFSDAARELSESFARNRLAARAQAEQVGAGVKQRGESLANQRLGMLLSLI